MRINSMLVVRIGLRLANSVKYWASKPSKQYPRMALRSPLEGLFVLSGCGLPLVLYKEVDYERKRGYRNTIRTY
jgi:hypothetical protein